MPTLEQHAARRIRVRGLVQGVGFRPAVHRLATSLNLRGWVCNDADGVLIHVEGADPEVGAFARLLRQSVPAAARIEEIVNEIAACSHREGFEIRVGSTSLQSSLTAQVPADRGVCKDCRTEILDPTNRRHRHPFASCISCGPRYSILREMPYERCGTTMRSFAMCRACRVEFENPDDRRYHAEPTACPDCGPRLRYVNSAGPIIGDWNCILAAAHALGRGRIVALKGLGGYQLLVRADDNAAVMRLRRRKRRPSKPFAVMVHTPREAERIAILSRNERSLLVDPANPIVLVKSRNTVAAAVAPGLGQVGIFLPTTPVHTLLLSQLNFPVVATSGNESDEPIAIDAAGREPLMAIADSFLEHDRRIARRVDDSVVRIIDDRVHVIRMARGFAPLQLPALQHWAARSDGPIPPILAVGGQQKTALALWTGSQAVLAQHIGDMDNPKSRAAFEHAVRDLTDLYRCELNELAGDCHPEYFTTRWAQAAGVPFLQVQHHHAHAVACMIEHDLLDRRVLGIIFDGTGIGSDGTIWGGEILAASMSDFQRVASLDPFALPGGEAAIHDPNRIALSLLMSTFGKNKVPPWLSDRLGFTQRRAQTLLCMIERGVNAPITSSVGRLFDGVAALLLNISQVTYEGEAAVLLEDAVDPAIETAYLIESRRGEDSVMRGDWRPMIRNLVTDVANDVPAGICAARFHNALAAWVATVASSFEREDVVLGGGCFQNALLLTRTRALLAKLGKRIHVPSYIPANDGGLAAGQLGVAMALWNQQHRKQTHVSRHTRPHC